MTVTLITGANKGLGHETARRLIDQGQTVLVGARDHELGATAARALGARFAGLAAISSSAMGRAVASLSKAAAFRISRCGSSCPGRCSST